MPRGPRRKPAAEDYPDRVNLYGLSMAYDSYLPIRHGEYFDVYMGEDRYAEYRFTNNLEIDEQIAELKSRRI